MIGYTGIQIEDVKMKELVAAVSRTAATASGFDEEKVSLTIVPPVPAEASSPAAKDTIVFCIYAGGVFTPERKKKNTEMLTTAIREVLGQQTNVILLFKNGTTDDSGLDAHQLTELVRGAKGGVA